MTELCWLKSFLRASLCYAVLAVSVSGVAYLSVYGIATGGIREVEPNPANHLLEPQPLYISGALA